MKKHYINTLRSIEMVIIAFIFLCLALCCTLFNSKANLIAYICSVSVFLLFFALAVSEIFLFEFHYVVIREDSLRYIKIFKEETVFFDEIDFVEIKKQTVIDSIIFHVPQHKDYFVIKSRQKTIKLPTDLFYYDEQNNKFVGK